ncbi:MAG TPA: DUF3291 domain-containing protein [Terriglobia bacterium]|nr:DUF3291 domain-containing protein [Terriglobia bacterium]
MALVSVTRLRVRALRFLPAFSYYALLSNGQVRRAPGNLSADFPNDTHWAFWTCTVWKDEPAMRSFMMAPPHRSAMPKLIHCCHEAAVVHWIQESEIRPDWNEAWRRLSSEGRPSKVSHPSADHLAFRIAVPMRKTGP